MNDPKTTAMRRAQRSLAGVLAIGGAVCCLAALWAQDGHGVVLMAGTSAAGSLLWRIA